MDSRREVDGSREWADDSERGLTTNPLSQRAGLHVADDPRDAIGARAQQSAQRCAMRHTSQLNSIFGPSTSPMSGRTKSGAITQVLERKVHDDLARLRRHFAPVLHASVARTKRAAESGSTTAHEAHIAALVSTAKLLQDDSEWSADRGIYAPDRDRTHNHLWSDAGCELRSGALVMVGMYATYFCTYPTLIRFCRGGCDAGNVRRRRHPQRR